ICTPVARRSKTSCPSRSCRCARARCNRRPSDAGTRCRRTSGEPSHARRSLMRSTPMRPTAPAPTRPSCSRSPEQTSSRAPRARQSSLTSSVQSATKVIAMLRRESLRTPGRRIRRLGLTTLLCVTACADRASRGSEDVAGDGDGEPGTGDGDGEPGTGDGDGDGEPGTGDGDGEPHEQPCESEHDGMICIPAGPFIMGSSGLAYLGELEIPEQQVEMSRYHIDRHEVTFGEYRACVDAGVCTPPTVENP